MSDVREALIAAIRSYDGPGWRTLDVPQFKDEPTAAELLAEHIIAARALPVPEPVAAPADWVIRKRGLFYRPDRCGYTASIAKAGRYTEAEARAEAGIEPELIVAQPASDFAEPVAPPVVTAAEIEAGAKLLGWHLDLSPGQLRSLARGVLLDAREAALREAGR